ncbi:uncharacterized protein SPAPADRAFT_61546 [Spathaspora passalidarum NRRL Y-27907]|uniref:Uncharacterized protein n=1 Tax=Spathaspora passalidarum (strain NRRL Y-27907 / 11-Y1) TaxID=619300 RepID=G3AN97_SPAPN|nr:uncharacterized protein SPAPADRAFT_61546 [Spathaspora passalidarum NRRL Y-27907]EGW32480.1 hypothetical protein SPAPADRAFT_61546 [Spathaspora passalidarum NRRL Y-27907]
MFSKKNKSVIDKVQLFLIISIKLFMTGLKLIVPLTKYVYHKFQHNQFYLLNSKNADKLIDYILKLMNYLDTKLNNNEDIIDKISQHDYIKSEEQMEQIYKDFTNYAGELFDPSKVMDKYISKDDSIKKGMVEFFINRMSREDKSSYEKNPKYNMYYSGRSKNPTPRSTTPKPNTSRNSHLFDRRGNSTSGSETSSVSGYKSCASYA